MGETEKVPQHKHCYVCGKAHNEDVRFCGDKCKESKKAELSKKKRQLFIIQILLMGITIGIIFMGMS
jgi:predicted nucleic acid-binding Zn ribbon protein